MGPARLATSGVSAFLDCEAQHFDAQLVADATNLAKAVVMKVGLRYRDH